MDIFLRNLQDLIFSYSVYINVLHEFVLRITSTGYIFPMLLHMSSFFCACVSFREISVFPKSNVCFPIIKMGNISHIIFMYSLRILFHLFTFRRFDISVRKMYDQIKSGDVGKLRMIKLLARELPAWINVDYLKSSGKSY